ncbi:MAG: hypothetical protein O2793_16880 [Proteobacteria bacterium]|nr:hypothetical protein [Pseudomonadota bacterium]
MMKYANFIKNKSLHSHSKRFFSSKNIATCNKESSNELYYVSRFIPTLTKDSKVIIPISMTRYDGDSVKRKNYDQEISSLLTYTANRLEKGELGSVDIISTSGLQKINWNNDKANEIEKHFMETHKEMLKKQTKVYTWDGLIEKLGTTAYANNYDLIKLASEATSSWYNLMLRTSESTNVNSSFEKSLEYQRREYAAILSMKSIYSHIAYMGKISPAWSYLYQQYNELPIFTRIAIDKIKNKSEITATDANACINMIFNNIEGILVNENFSMKDKKRLADMVSSLFRTYMPRENDIKELISSNASDEVNDSKKQGL